MVCEESAYCARSLRSLRVGGGRKLPEIAACEPICRHSSLTHKHTTGKTSLTSKLINVWKHTPSPPSPAPPRYDPRRLPAAVLYVLRHTCPARPNPTPSPPPRRTQTRDQPQESQDSTCNAKMQRQQHQAKEKGGRWQPETQDG